MRYLSKWGRLLVQVRPMSAEAFANGVVRVIQEPIYAQFEPLGVTTNEREMALAFFSFEGYYQEQDEATVVPPDYRIGVYDTIAAQQQHGWTNETRLEVESILRGLADNYVYLIEVPTTFATPPWPRYDDYKGSTASLVRKLVDEGHDLTNVLEYERAMQNRADVTEAIEQAQQQADVLEEEVVG